MSCELYCSSGKQTIKVGNKGFKISYQAHETLNSNHHWTKYVLLEKVKKISDIVEMSHKKDVKYYSFDVYCRTIEEPNTEQLIPLNFTTREDANDLYKLLHEYQILVKDNLIELL